MTFWQRFLFKLSNMQKAAESAWVRSRLKLCGDAVRIDHRVFIWSPEQLELGNRIDINGYTVIYASGGVQIEDNVLIGANCVITSVTHPVGIATRHRLEFAPVILRQNCWVGAGTVVLPGVTIGRNSIVAAGSVVTENVPDDCVCAGVPAKVKRFINDKELCKE